MPVPKPEQRYGPTSGTVTGALGVLICLVVAVWLPIASHDLVATRWALGIGAGAVLIWAFMLRPRIVVQPEMLVLRNPLSSWLVPLACVEVVQVCLLTRIGTTGGATYDAVAVARPLRSLTGRQRLQPSGLFGRALSQDSGSESPKLRYARTNTPDGIADLMTEQILAAAHGAREAGAAAGPVRRVWAIPELAVTATLLVGLGLTWIV